MIAKQKKMRVKKEKQYPQDTFWFKWSFDEPALLDMKDFVTEKLGVPSQSTDFDNVMVRVAWAMHKLVERWDVKPCMSPGAYKSRVGVLIDKFADGTANPTCLEETLMSPRAAEAMIYGDHEYEPTDEAKSFFIQCKKAWRDVEDAYLHESKN